MTAPADADDGALPDRPDFRDRRDENRRDSNMSTPKRHRHAPTDATACSVPGSARAPGDSGDSLGYFHWTLRMLETPDDNRMAAMSAPLKTVEKSTDITAVMIEIGRGARAAARPVALAPEAQKNQALAAMVAALRRSATAILAANADDLAEAKAAGAT